MLLTSNEPSNSFQLHKEPIKILNYLILIILTILFHRSFIHHTEPCQHFCYLKHHIFFPHYNDLTVTVLSVLLKKKKKKRVPDSFACRENFFKAFAIREEIRIQLSSITLQQRVQESLRAGVRNQINCLLIGFFQKQTFSYLYDRKQFYNLKQGIC